MPLRPPIDMPRNNREFTRWCQEQNVTADDDTVTTSALQDASVTTAKIADDAVATAKIPDEAVTLAKLADMTADRILGRLSANGVPTELTAVQVAGLLQDVAWVFASTVTFDGNVGFYATTPVAQQSDPGAASISAVSGTGDDATIDANFTSVVNTLNGIRTALNNYGLTA